MKIKSLFFASAVLLAALTGCNKEDGNGPDTDGLDPNGVSSIFLQFTEATRAETSAVPDNEAVTFSEGMIFFVNGNTNQIQKSFTIGAGQDYTITQLKSGTTFTGISNAANVVYVVGNHTFSGPTGEGDSMTALLGEATDLAKQGGTTYGVDKATLVGEGNLVTSIRQGIEREAIVTIAPIIGRIEIGKLTLTDDLIDPALATDTIVTSFKLAGIFVNNFYFDAAVHGGLVSAGQQPYRFGKVPANYDVDPAGKYEAAWAKYVFDQYSAFSVSNSTDALVPSGKTIAPATGVWAYNLFSTPQDLPRIVLHLKDVEIECYDDDSDVSQGTSQIPYPNAITTDGTAYLTVLTYTEIDDQGATIGNIETIETGKIYKIDELSFNYFDLTDEPEGNYVDPDDEFKVWVEVRTLNWKAVNVSGGW